MGSTTFSGPVTSKAGFITGTDANILTEAATLAVTQEAHSGRIINLGVASGTTVTLPAATGTNAMYRFLVTVSVTSNNDIIKVANATDVMVGTASVAGTTGVSFGTLPASDTITMNGSTSGGLAGSYIEVTDIAAGIFVVRGNLLGSGSVVTPFSATVS